jgi:hypothetical protein
LTPAEVDLAPEMGGEDIERDGEEEEESEKVRSKRGGDGGGGRFRLWTMDGRGPHGWKKVEQGKMWRSERRK